METHAVNQAVVNMPKHENTRAEFLIMPKHEHTEGHCPKKKGERHKEYRLKKKQMEADKLQYLMTSMDTNYNACLQQLIFKHSQEVKLLQIQIKDLEKACFLQTSELEDLKSGVPKVRDIIIRGWVLQLKLFSMPNNIWRTRKGDAIGNSLIWGSRDCTEKDVQDSIRFVKFNGHIVKLNPEELSIRPSSCYFLHIKEGVYLDCEDNAKAGKCLASMSNCCTGLVHMYDTSLKAEPNCKLITYPAGSNHLWLALTKCIKFGEEVLWNYGPEFKFGKK